MTAPVVVTGAAGLLGRAVLARLEHAIGVDRSTADLAVDASPVALLRPRAVVHFAGNTSGDEQKLIRSNVETTRRLLRSLAAAQIRPHVIVAGSAAEYGEPHGDEIEETSPLAPLTAYGRVKAEQTRVAQEEAGRAGIPLTVVRPFNVVSPDLPASTALGNVRRQLLEQYGPSRRLLCGRLDVVRDYVTARFVADVVAALLETDDAPDVLNVCSGVGIELRSIVESAAEMVGAELEIVEVPELVQVASASRVVGSPARLARLGLSFQPTPASLAAELLGQ